MRSLSYGKRPHAGRKRLVCFFTLITICQSFYECCCSFYISLPLLCVLCLSSNDPKTFPTHKIGNKEHTGYTNPLIIGDRHKNGCTHPPWRGLEPLVIFVSLVLVPAGDLKAIGILQHSIRRRPSSVSAFSRVSNKDPSYRRKEKTFYAVRNHFGIRNSNWTATFAFFK